MNVQIVLLFLLIVGIRSQIPQSNQGPGGSRFTLIDSWPDSDLAAFVDINADRRTDALVWSSGLKTLQVLLAPNAKQPGSKPKLQELMKFNLSESDSLRSVVVADFNGDSRADYLYIVHSGDKYEGNVVFGPNFDSVSVGPFSTQPVVCDVNADMIADIYGEDLDGQRFVELGSSANFSRHNYSNSPGKLSKPGNSGFAPLASNTNPSLVVLSENGQLQVYNNLLPANDASSKTTETDYIQLPEAVVNAVDAGLVGKFVFGDFDMSNNIQLLMIGCERKGCENSAFIFLCSFLSKGTCEKIPVEWTPPGVDIEGTWTLAPANLTEFSSSAMIGPSLGDSDLDGYPDLAVGLLFKPANGRIDSIAVPAILRNLRGSSGSIKFQAYLLPGFQLPSKTDRLKQIAFYDFNEDGVLDLFISYSDEKNTVKTMLYVQKMTKEAYFLKVMLTTGRCGSPGDCDGGVLPYGLPGYGFRAAYETQGADGNRIRSSGVFVSSSCCGALQLPFTTFGFGDFATYIESVPVSVPAPRNQARTHALTFIVPNTQVVVVPFPYNSPSDWRAKLFLEPLYDMKVIYVAITLLVTCVVLIIIISILQCLEVRSDQHEKMQESQRFHFDAM